MVQQRGASTKEGDESAPMDVWLLISENGELCWGEKPSDLLSAGAPSAKPRKTMAARLPHPEVDLNRALPYHFGKCHS